MQYDLLSINTGSVPDVSRVNGADGNVVPVKPINNFLSRWEELTKRLMAANGPARIAVVGGGAGGVEILLATQHRLKQMRESVNQLSDDIEFHLFSDSKQILPTHGPAVRSNFERVLKARGVQLHLGDRVTEVEPGSLQLFGLSSTGKRDIMGYICGCARMARKSRA